MPARNDALKDGLSQDSEITITVTGRKSGRSVSIPVWFVLDQDTLYLLPVKGSETQWYKNVLNNRPFASMLVAQRPNSRLSLSLTPRGSQPWSKNFARSTGPPT